MQKVLTIESMESLLSDSKTPISLTPDQRTHRRTKLLDWVIRFATLTTNKAPVNLFEKDGIIQITVIIQQE